MELLEDNVGSGVFMEEPLGLCVQGGDTGVSRYPGTNHSGLNRGIIIGTGK